MKRRMTMLMTLALINSAAWAYVAIVNKVDNEQIHIVPATGAVTIDGDLSDWDLSGAILMYIDPASRDIYSVRGAMMYDEGYLYVGAHVKDPTPMINNYAFGGQVGMSWNADAIQLRILSNPDIQSRASVQTGGHMSQEDQYHVNHITLWYSTIDQQPGYYALYTLGFRDAVLNPPGVEGAYRKDDDGRGYTLEYRIPWAVLRAPRPWRGGDEVQVQWQLHWGNDQGTRVRMGMTDVRSREGSKDLGYMGPRSWGVGIVEAEGNLELPDRDVFGRAEGHIPISFTMERDGKASLAIHDRDGRLIRTGLGAQLYPAGEQVWLWDGLDDADRPVAPGDYTVHMMTHDGIKQIYVTNIGVSGTPPYQTEDGAGGWAGDYRFPQTMVIEGDAVILGTASAEAAPYSIRTDLDGRKIYGTRAHGHAIALRDGVGYALGAGNARVTRFNVADGLLSPFTTGHPEVAASTRREGESQGDWSSRAWQMHGLAVVGDRLVVSSRSENKLYLLDLASGEPRGTMELAAPMGLAASPDGRLYAVSGNAVGRFDLETGQFTTVRDGLDSPQHLALDEAGNIYVSLRGQTMQVWRLSRRRLFRQRYGVEQRYGKAGGRPALGDFDRDGMLNPFGIAVDRNGRLWVAEADPQPKRYSVWNPDGSLWRDFYGSIDYSTRANAHPLVPEHVYMQSVRYRVDYEQGTWEVDATVLRPSEDNGVKFTTQSGHSGGDFAVVDDRTFFWTRSQSHPTLYEWVDGRFVPRMAAGSPTANHWWLDDNNDGRVQAEEIRQGRLPFGVWLGAPMDGHLNVYGHTGPTWANQGGGKTTQPYRIHRWEFKGFNEHGGLVYADPASPTVVAEDPDGGAVSQYMPDDDGNVYVLVSGGSLDRGVRPQGSGHRVVAFGPDGAKRWEYHNVHCAFAWTSDPYQPGDLVGVLAFATGTTDDLIAVIGYYGQYFLLDKRTGLFVDALGEDQRSAYTLDQHMVLTENFNGSMFRHPETGKTYFFGGDADQRVWELGGLDTIRRHTLPVSVSQAEVALAEAAARHNYMAQQQAIGNQALKLVRLENAAADGRYDEWAEAPVRTIVMDRDRTVQVLAGYDDENLYVLYQVRAEAPFLNTPTDPRLLFKSGSSVEIQLGTDMTERAVRGQNVQEMRPGDLRLIMARTADGRTVATRYRWVSETAEKPHRHTFDSPTGEETVDEVVTLDSVMQHHAAEDGGYTVEVAIPWRELGIEPESGLTLSGDLGVIFGNVGGTRNAIRYMWSDKSPEVSINNDIPSELRIHPNQWGTWMME